MIAPGRRIFQGIVGSTAYGLDREGSDVDHLGIYVVPTEELFDFGWNKHRETWSNSGPTNDNDTTLHELGKFCRLALKGNPTILELLWLPQDCIEIETPTYHHLRSLRRCFLNERSVRDAYGGYAKQQVDRLQRRNAEGKVGFSSDTQKRTAKHARHCFRLLAQGAELLATAEMHVRISDPETYWSFDNASVEEIVERFAEADANFKSIRSVLPAESDIDVIQAFLNKIRRDNL